MASETPFSFSFQEAVDYLTGLAPRGWRLGLDRMEEFIRLAGLQAFTKGAEKPAYVHVAGTNGKGSTTAFLQAMMLSQGYRTGAYFSPYVYDPRERVQFGYEVIPQDDFARGVGLLAGLAAKLEGTDFEGVTEFEMKTALGFWYWREKQAEVVALEVGLGGRLDATNVIEPAASIIVSIGWDHMTILGNSLQEIAWEKAGVIKPGKPVVVGRVSPEAAGAIQSRIDEVGAHAWWMDRDIVIESHSSGVKVSTPGGTIQLEPSLFGEIQHHNSALAYAALEMGGLIRDPAAAALGASHARIPGRFQRIEAYGKTWILDGAHNLDAGQILSKQLTEADLKGVGLLTGMLHGHDPEPFFNNLYPFISQVFLARIDFHRTMDPNDLLPIFEERDFPAHSFQEAATAVAAAAGSEARVILVTGSFYLVGEVMRLLLQPSPDRE